MLYIEVKKNVGVVDIINYITNKDFSLYSIEKAEKKKQKENLCIYMEINLKKRLEHSEIVSQINLIDSVIYAEEVKY